MNVRQRIAVRQPYNAPWLFGYLARRALKGTEVVEGLCYRRKLDAAAPAWVEVRWEDDGLTCILPQVARVHSRGKNSGLHGEGSEERAKRGAQPTAHGEQQSRDEHLGHAESIGARTQADVHQRLPDRATLLRRVRRLFDVDADSTVIDVHLSHDDLLGPRVRTVPGLRVPGAWDGFETAVRAVLGQQVSIERATRLAELLMERFGDGAFPSAAMLAEANPSEIGLTRQRGEAIRRLAAAADAGSLQLDETADSAELQEQLRSLPGIGPWTASYIALRVAKDADAFPESDWGVLKALGTTAAGARRRAQAWKPWRGYALMYLWHGGANTQHSNIQPIID